MGLEIINSLYSPPDKFRPYPFWFWNGDISTDEITWQLEECHRQRITTVLIHPRYGLITPYLSDKYMGLVLHAVKVAERLGMRILLYDEYNWPSGTVGGRLLHDYPQYRMKFLRYEYMETRGGQVINPIWRIKGDLICIQGCNLVSGKIHSFTTEADGTLKVPPGQWGIAAFYLLSSIALDCVRGHSHAFPETGYLDVLNPQAVKKFIELTHEAYYSHLWEYFGSVIEGIFTDEPGMIYDFDYGYDFNTAISSSLPWSETLEQSFSQIKGYLLRDKLIHLIADVHGAIKTRSDYWEVVTSLYTQSYHAQVSQWCADHGIAYTGHVLSEEQSLHYQGDIYSALKYFHVPGMDWTSKGCNPVGAQTAKVVSSIAHAQNRAFTVCEAYGATGWGLTLNDMKRVVDCLYSLGINQICLHGFFYTIRGFRKYECPPSEFFQNPWWKYMGIYSDYVARLGFMLSQGRHMCEVGVLMPTRIYWARNNRTVFDADSRWPHVADCWPYRISRTLLEIGVDHEFVFDSALNSDHITKAGIKCGDELINTLIIPPVEFLSIDLWTKINKFLDHGGKVILIGDAPYVLDADLQTRRVESDTVESVIGKGGPIDDVALKNFFCREFAGKRIEVIKKDAQEGIAVLRRVMSDGTVICFVYNFSGNNLDSCDLVFPGIFEVSEVNLETLSVLRSKVLIRDERTVVQSSFFPYQSRVFMMGKSFEAISTISYREPGNKRIIRLGPVWDFSLDKKNVFRISKAIIIPFAAGNGADLYFNVYRDDEIENIMLLLEGDISRHITVNGIEISYRKRECRYFDGGQVVVDIGDCLHKGLNRFSLDYHPLPEDNVILSPLMAYSGIHSVHPHIFIIGDFGVTPEEHLASCPKIIKSGSWREQGFPYYVGTGIYRTNINMHDDERSSAIMSCDVGGGCAEVVVNGCHCGTRVWEPYFFDVTKALKAGDNVLEIRVTNSALNLLRPLNTEVDLTNAKAYLREIHKACHCSGLVDAYMEVTG